jgi:hypothetical protein
VRNTKLTGKLVKIGNKESDKILISGYSGGECDLLFKGVILVNLTETFGAGNEPTKDECDQIFANYFDGTKSTISASRLKSVGKNLLKLNTNVAKGKATYDILDLTRNRFYYKRNSGGIHDTVNIGEVKATKGKVYTVTFDFEDRVGQTTILLGTTPLGADIGTIPIAIGSVSPRSISFTSNTNNICLAIRGDGVGSSVIITSLRLEEGAVATPYEPYKESNAYVITKGHETGEILEARSVPSANDEVRDIICITNGKAELIRKVGNKKDVPNGTVINYADMADDGVFEAWGANGEHIVGVKGDTLDFDAVELNYQLAEPIEIPVQVSGSIVSYPNGTIYIERILPDAGVYTDKITILHQDAPIKRLDRLSKVDFIHRSRNRVRCQRSGDCRG